MSINKDLIEIDVGVGLSDSELISYFYHKTENKLVIKLQIWDASVVEICCDSPILFVDRGCGETSLFCQKTSDSDMLKRALETNYDKGIIPNNHPYKVYQILDLDDNPSIEIICKGIEIHRIR
ncbi:unknown protein [Waddlia chondrophila 2032/99]|uniref:Uncharacterized protein n=1 Tax=Waddlia chondrophila 2032/99 TaxID=765953 RepID=F8LEE7_9BACT|nr:hypothetical protein [Waddlia chondrophila]CCB91863.1 unknown protein [Waddlia chondrophila 2032/99]